MADPTLATLLDALHRDHTGLAAGLGAVLRLCDSYSWLREGRGLHARDDEAYREEIGACLDDIRATAQQALRQSAAHAHQYCCPRPVLTLTTEEASG